MECVRSHHMQMQVLGCKMQAQFAQDQVQRLASVSACKLGHGCVCGDKGGLQTCKHNLPPGGEAYS
jgi:hypothetical protein